MSAPASRRGRCPVVMVLAVCVFTAGASFARQTAEPREIDVVVRRYAFEPAQIEVAVGERVKLVVRSGDGLHGFEIKRFRVSKEIPRGNNPVVIEFTADEAGRFPVLCSVYCGEGHDNMKGELVVTARESGQR